MEEQKQTKVISGFPGVGKSYIFNTYAKEKGLVVADSDSSNFSWISKGVRNPDFPNNYMAHIISLIGKVDVIMVSSHKEVREAMKEHNIDFMIVYPDKSLKEEYLKRYKDRGNDEGFIKMIESKWDEFIDDIENENTVVRIRLDSGEYLKHALEVDLDDVMNPEPIKS